MKLNPGDVVLIHEDPISQIIREGHATLLKCLIKHGPASGQYWAVKFLKDPEAGVCNRWIYPREDTDGPT